MRWKNIFSEENLDASNFETFLNMLSNFIDRYHSNLSENCWKWWRIAMIPTAFFLDTAEIASHAIATLLTVTSHLVESYNLTILYSFRRIAMIHGFGRWLWYYKVTNPSTFIFFYNCIKRWLNLRYPISVLFPTSKRIGNTFISQYNTWTKYKFTIKDSV